MSLIGMLVRLADPLGKILKSQRKLTEQLAPDASYENLLLDVVLDINDPRGRRAVVNRRQRIRFLTGESGVIRELMWGEGQLLKSYKINGAGCLAVRKEGARQALLLALGHAPCRGEQALLQSTRVVQDGFTQSAEYFETIVERPTRRMTAKVIFPLRRPPKEAYLVSEASSRRLPVRYRGDGRAFLSWRKSEPERYRLYSLRWSW